MIKAGDIVQVLAHGVFHGQEVNVLRIHARKRLRPTYQLATKWETREYPAWFDEHEIKLLRKQQGATGECI